MNSKHFGAYLIMFVIMSALYYLAFSWIGVPSLIVACIALGRVSAHELVDHE